MTAADRIYGPPSDCYIVEAGQRWAYAHRSTYSAGVALLEQCRLDDPARFDNARVVLADRHLAEIEKADLDVPIVEITAARFHDMLNCLPPLAWVNDGGFERFNMSEFTAGRITAQLARLGDRYFTRPVRHGDRTTYLSPAVISDALAAGQVAFSERSSSG